jgi:hypothetical protein
MINDDFMFMLLTYVFQLRLVLFYVNYRRLHVLCHTVVYVACSTSVGDNDDNAYTKAAHAKSPYLATYVADTSSFCIVFVLCNRVECDKLPSVM